MQWNRDLEHDALTQITQYPDEHLTYPTEAFTARGRILITTDHLTTSLHRYLFELTRFPLYGDYCLRTCDNPNCLNPFHHVVSHAPRLYGEKKARTTGRPTRGAQNAAKNACPYGHPYTAENTYTHKSRTGYTSRYCKTCRTNRNNARKARHAQ